jgi:hypothetical protein
MPRIEKVTHVVRIQQWSLDYHFGIDETKHRTGPYYDYRHLRIFGPVIEPQLSKVRRGEICCFPTDGLIGASERPINRIARLGQPGLSQKTRPIGYVSYRGADYSANLHFPSDMLLILITMLSNGKYRYLVFEASKGSRDSEIHSFYFSGNRDGEEDGDFVD